MGRVDNTRSAMMKQLSFRVAVADATAVRSRSLINPRKRHTHAAVDNRELPVQSLPPIIHGPRNQIGMHMRKATAFRSQSPDLDLWIIIDR